MKLTEVYTRYEQWQDQGRLLRTDEFFAGAWLFTRYVDVAWVLKDPRFSAKRTGGWLHDTHISARKELAAFKQIFSRALLFLDAPDHTRLRQALAPAFVPAKWQHLAQQLTAKTHQVLDALPTNEPFDFMAQVAIPLTAEMIVCLLGLTTVNQAELLHWSDSIASFIGHPAPDLALALKAQHAALSLAAVFEEEFKFRQKRGAVSLMNDWIDILINAKAQGLIQNTPELLAQCVMLLFAGHETTRHLLGNGLHAVLEQEGAWLALQQQPAGLSLALREMLRYDSPVQYTGRRVAQDVVFEGQVLKRGDLVIALIAAANRDPWIYTQANTLQLMRKQAPHLSFGSGVHACIGAALTYFEAQTIWQVLLERWREPRLVGQAMLGTNLVYKGWHNLPLCLV